MKVPSKNLIKNHFTLYQDYVTNSNKVFETFQRIFNEEKMLDPWEMLEFSDNYDTLINILSMEEF